VNRRILIIDDNRYIHEDFRKVLVPVSAVSDSLEALEAEMFGDSVETIKLPPFEITSAYQGREGLELIEKACAENQPFTMAFVDVRMPPGWDGIETISRIWKVAPLLEVVICTAYSDYSWEQIVEKLGTSDKLTILRKPFDPVEVQHLACTLTEKWNKLHGNQQS
jgi:CheY-like chemotaxis protein